MQATYGSLKEFMEKQLQRNAYSIVNLKFAFNNKSSIPGDIETTLKRNLHTLKTTIDEEDTDVNYLIC